jgi:hypothetical protein
MAKDEAINFQIAHFQLSIISVSDDRNKEREHKLYRRIGMMMEDDKPEWSR